MRQLRLAQLDREGVGLGDAEAAWHVENPGEAEDRLNLPCVALADSLFVPP